jgi:hypothetical protein
MPLKIDPKDRKLILGAACVFLLLIAGTALLGGPAGRNSDTPSSYSTTSGGANAAYLLLADAGYKEERWEKPLNELPQAKGNTLILAEPSEAPTREEREHLNAFISYGGRLIAMGMFAGTFLPENHSVPDILGGLTWKKASAASPSAITRAAPEIVLASEASWLSFSSVYPLYREGDHVVVVKYPYGRGEVIWCAAATPLTNAGLKEPGNLEFLLASLGEKQTNILWDEYIHGYRPSLALSIAHSPVKWIALQLILLGMAVIVTYSRRSGPIFKPAPDVRLSPLEFVHTLGGLYEHAGSASVAVDVSYQRFRYWLTRHLGVGSNIPLEELSSVVRKRWAVADDHFIMLLRRCETARYDPYLSATQALHLVEEINAFSIRFKLFSR